MDLCFYPPFWILTCALLWALALRLDYAFCLDYAMASDASATLDLDYRQTCDRCKTRMSSLLHDRHSICNVCRGFVCSLRSVVLSLNHGLMFV